MPERYWVPTSFPWRMPWVGSWAHALGGIMRLPEDPQQTAVIDAFRIEHHPHHFVVAGLSRTNLLIGGIGRVTTGIAHGRDMNAGQFPEANMAWPKPSGNGGMSP